MPNQIVSTDNNDSGYVTVVRMKIIRRLAKEKTICDMCYDWKLQDNIRVLNTCLSFVGQIDQNLSMDVTKIYQTPHTNLLKYEVMRHFKVYFKHSIIRSFCF